MKTYRLSPAGRRTAIVLLVAALIVWAFAIWTLQATLGTNPDPTVGFFDALRQNIQNGLGVNQLVPALLMVVLIIATPLAIWNILEEWAAAYTPTDDGLHFRSLGVDMLYPWSGIISSSRENDDTDEVIDELRLKEDYTKQITNPAVRFLHRQAYGRKKLPIYAGLSDRDELLSTISAHTGLVFGGPRDEAGVETRDDPSIDGSRGVAGRV